MTKKKILIFDDVEDRARKWADRLKRLPFVRKNFDLHPMTMVEFEDTVGMLNQRRRDARTNKKATNIVWDHPLDEAAILIVDYDLLELNKITYITAEEVAYLARCYSHCGLIVVLNQFGKNEFDLTLKGHPESFADLNLGSEQIYNPGLWEEPWKGFRPWVWPLLPRALETYEKRSIELRSALDHPIPSFLGIEGIVGLLPRTTVEFLQSRSRKIEETTFKDFVEGSRHGLGPRDKPIDDEAIARIAAARIHKWLERLVLPGQDILVDTPHLVSRFPSLLQGNLKSKTTWKNVVTFESPSKAILKTNVIDRFRFKKDAWVSRTCWIWGQLSGYEEIEEVKNPWKKTEKADVVFCEDLSAYAPREAAKEFVADLSSPFVRRYVAQADGVVYQPLVRFAM